MSLLEVVDYSFLSFIFYYIYVILFFAFVYRSYILVNSCDFVLTSVDISSFFLANLRIYYLVFLSKSFYRSVSFFNRVI
jgi:hypothetical protein